MSVIPEVISFHGISAGGRRELTHSATILQVFPVAGAAGRAEHSGGFLRLQKAFGKIDRNPCKVPRKGAVQISKPAVGRAVVLSPQEGSFRNQSHGDDRQGWEVQINSYNPDDGAFGWRICHYGHLVQGH
ncbi:MAG: hypothetical protein U0903_09880 [Planctomycetales bacterium]